MFFSLVKHCNANRFTFYRNLTENFEPAAILPPARPYLIQRHFLEGGTEIPWQDKTCKQQGRCSFAAALFVLARYGRLSSGVVPK